MTSMNKNLVGRVFCCLEDVCSIDIGRNPVIPFGGRCVVKCDESKFNHKAKVYIFKMLTGANEAITTRSVKKQMINIPSVAERGNIFPPQIRNMPSLSHISFSG